MYHVIQKIFKKSIYVKHICIYILSKDIRYEVHKIINKFLSKVQIIDYLK